MKPNPKFAQLLRYSNETMTLLVGVALFTSLQSPPASSPPPQAKSPANPGIGSGAMPELASLVPASQEFSVSFRGSAIKAENPTTAFGGAIPDGLVIRVPGERWRALIEWALQHDLPVTVMPGD